MTGFHEHLPFLHIPTISTSSASVELILAIAAVGAQYCREPEKSVQIFHAAQAVAMESIRERDRRNARHPGLNNEIFFSRPNHGQDASYHSGIALQTTAKLLGKPMETAQALLLLMAMATWFEHTTLARAAMTMRSQLESLVHDEGLGPKRPVHKTTWENWIEHEGSKRTKFIIYCFFNLHCITFDIPPLILNRTLGMDLPCSEAQWKSTSADDWVQIRQKEKSEPSFQDASTRLFSGQNVDSETTEISTLGGYILILTFVIQMIAETEYAASPEQQIGNGKHLSAAVVRLWAKLFRSDSIWQIIDVIGRSLNIYADMIEP